MYMDACSASDEFPHELFPSLLLHAWIRQRDYSDALSKHVCAELVVCAKAGYVSVAVDGGRGEGCESRSTYTPVLLVALVAAASARIHGLSSKHTQGLLGVGCKKRQGMTCAGHKGPGLDAREGKPTSKRQINVHMCIHCTLFMQ